MQVSKKLACGDVGNGAMASPDDIVAATKQAVRMCQYVPYIWEETAS